MRRRKIKQIIGGILGDEKIREPEKGKNEERLTGAMGAYRQHPWDMFG